MTTMRFYTYEMCMQIEKIALQRLNEEDYEQATYEYRRARARYVTLIERNINVDAPLARCDLQIEYMSDFLDEDDDFNTEGDDFE